MKNLYVVVGKYNDEINDCAIFDNAEQSAAASRAFEKVYGADCVVVFQREVNAVPVGIYDQMLRSLIAEMRLALELADRLNSIGHKWEPHSNLKQRVDHLLKVTAPYQDEF